MNVRKAVARFVVFSIAVLGATSAGYARGGGAANLLNSPGYQRAQKDARDNYLRAYYGVQQVAVTRKKHPRHPH